MMAWSALAGAARIALGEPQDLVRVEGIVTYTGPLSDPIRSPSPKQAQCEN